MKLKDIFVKNYKSIKNSGYIKLHNQMNIIAGKNNTGKTAFIEVLYKAFSANVVNDIRGTLDFVELALEVSLNEEEKKELYNFIKLDKITSELIHLEDDLRIYLEVNYTEKENYLLVKSMKMTIAGEKSYVVSNNTIDDYSLDTYGYKLYRFGGGNGETVPDTPQIAMNLVNIIKNKINYISSSRNVPNVHDANISTSLSITGDNLNEFLYTLHNNDETTFDLIKNSFIKIFDDVTSISTPIIQNNKTYISLYFDGLPYSVPLSSCGSGYTHVLLFLSVLYTKKDSLILFDEPQVYLHPSAEKGIYDLVSEILEHQYLFTTHSSILINYPVEKHIIHVRKERGASEFLDLENMQDILSDIGINNSDFALSDKVLFVEGETEEIVIPKILKKFGLRQIGYNYRVLNMKGTGKEFNHKGAMQSHRDKLDLILGGVSISPIPYRIIIDSDNKPQEKINELKEKYEENIIILDRREYENYFLDCYEDLAIVINSEAENEITGPSNIQQQIEEILSLVDDKKVFPRTSMDTMKDAVGSEILERLFASYNMTYNKIIHGSQLTDLVLERSPEKLVFFKRELSDFINGNH